MKEGRKKRKQVSKKDRKEKISKEEMIKKKKNFFFWGYLVLSNMNVKDFIYVYTYIIHTYLYKHIYT